MVSEVTDLNTVNWKPSFKRARKFVPLQAEPVVSKVRWKPFRKVVNSAEHSVKGYADDVTFISSNFDVHVTVLQTVDQRPGDLDLSFKPAKCMSYLFDGSKCLQKCLKVLPGQLLKERLNF